MSRIVQGFARVLRDDPRRPVIHLPLTGTTLTSQDLSEAATRQRAALERLGFGAGHLLIYAGGNRADLVALLLACAALDVAMMPVDAGTTVSEIAALASRFGALATVTADTALGIADLGTAEPFVPGLAALTLRGGTTVRDGYQGAAVLKLTSGSTGLPKATFTTDAQLVNDSEHIVSAMDIRPGDCQMAAIPLSHAYGLGNLAVPVLLQGTAIVLRETFVPQQFGADARAAGARVFPGVPFMFDHFNAHMSPGAWPPSLGRLISAGARLEGPTVRAFHSSFGLKVHSFYGTSETEGIAFDDSADIEEEATVGRPLPGVTISLRPEEGAPADGGRVHVAGNAVASGYAGGEAFDTGGVGDGFLTGDFGRFTSRGDLVLTGRVSSFINVAGRKVQPEEVEGVLRSMPGIADVRVVGAPDPARGQQIVACVVASSGRPDTLSVRQFCASRLAAHKIPRTVVVLERIPLTGRGKTDQPRLRAAVDEYIRGTSGTGVLE